MGINVSIVKMLDALSKKGKTSAPQQKTAQNDSSAFEAQQSRLQENRSSLTMILGNDYEDDKVRTKEEMGRWFTIAEPDENGNQIEQISRLYNRELNDQEKNTLAWSTVDHNRWMIDDINRTYLAQQIPPGSVREALALPHRRRTGMALG